MFRRHFQNVFAPLVHGCVNLTPASPASANSANFDLASSSEFIGMRICAILSQQPRPPTSF